MRSRLQSRRKYKKNKYKVILSTSNTDRSFNIGKPIAPHILDQFDIDRDISKGSSDTPKEATLINDKDLETMKLLEPPRF